VRSNGADQCRAVSRAVGWRSRSVSDSTNIGSIQCCCGAWGLARSNVMNGKAGGSTLKETCWEASAELTLFSHVQFERKGGWGIEMELRHTRASSRVTKGVRAPRVTVRGDACTSRGTIVETMGVSRAASRHTRR